MGMIHQFLGLASIFCNLDDLINETLNDLKYKHKRLPRKLKKKLKKQSKYN